MVGSMKGEPKASGSYLTSSLLQSGKGDDVLISVISLSESMYDSKQ